MQVLLIEFAKQVYLMRLPGGQIEMLNRLPIKNLSDLIAVVFSGMKLTRFVLPLTLAGLDARNCALWDSLGLVKLIEMHFVAKAIAW